MCMCVRGPRIYVHLMHKNWFQRLGAGARLPDLELQAIVSYWKWMLGMKPGSFARTI